MPFLVRLYRLAVIFVIAWLLYQESPLPTTAIDYSQAFPSGTAYNAESYEVRSAEEKLLGYYLTTSPQTDHLRGYSGPTNLGLALDPTGKLIDVKILASADTPDHVEDITTDPDFLDAHLGLALGSPGDPQIDAVSGSTLTSHAVTRSIIERLGGETTSRLFPTEILLAEFGEILPTAKSLETHPDWPGVMTVLDEKKNILGQALRTAPSLEYLHGYQGPTDTLIVLDPNGDTIIGLRFRKSYDNEEYYERILDDDDYLKLYNGKSVQEIIDLDYAKAGIEGVSGATMTSWAIAESVKRRLAQFDSQRQPVPFEFPWRNLLLIILTLGAIAFSFTKLRGRPFLRLSWQLFVIIILGLILGDLLSQALFIGWAKHGLPLADSYGLILLAAAALLVPWASGHQLYCHHLCPHGFLQQWFIKLPIKSLKIPSALHKILSKLPSLLLVIIVASLFLGASLNLADFEAFDAWLWRSAGIATIVIAILGLLASLFVPLAYCKYGCPTGALFRFLRKTSATEKFSSRDLIVGLLLIAATFS